MGALILQNPASMGNMPYHLWKPLPTGRCSCLLSRSESQVKVTVPFPLRKPREEHVSGLCQTGRTYKIQGGTALRISIFTFAFFDFAEDSEIHRRHRYWMDTESYFLGSQGSILAPSDGLQSLICNYTLAFRRQSGRRMHTIIFISRFQKRILVRCDMDSKE